MHSVSLIADFSVLFDLFFCALCFGKDKCVCVQTQRYLITTQSKWWMCACTQTHTCCPQYHLITTQSKQSFCFLYPGGQKECFLLFVCFRGSRLGISLKDVISYLTTESIHRNIVEVTVKIRTTLYFPDIELFCIVWDFVCLRCILLICLTFTYTAW